MPINKYYGGHGDEVMSNMTKEYGDKKGKSVFYATANKRGAKPMADGGMVVPDDPYYRDPRRTAGLPTVPDVPTSMPDEPPVTQAPPPPPSYAPQLNQTGYTGMADMSSLAKSGSLGDDIPPDIGVAGARADIPGAGDPQAAKVDAKTADSVTQNTPAATSDAYGANSDNPGSAPTSPETPPDVPPTIGKSTGYDMGPPKVTTPMTEQAIAYGKQVLEDPKHPDPQDPRHFKRPAAWQNILGGVLAASPKLRHIDLHPGLTREYQNYKMMTNMANEERLAQVAGAQEQSHRAQVMASLARANRDASKADPVQRYKDMQVAKRQDLESRGIKPGSPEYEKVMGGYNEPASLQMMNSLDPETIARAAERLVRYNELPAGSGRGGSAFIIKVHEAAAKYAKEHNIPISQQQLWALQSAADKASAVKLQTARDAMVGFEGTASRNLDIALANSKVLGRTGSPLVNEYLQWFQGKIQGSPELAKFKNAIETSVNEYARVTSGATSGPITDAARAQAKTMIHESMNKGTFEQVVAQMKQEMNNRREGYDEALSDIYARTGQRQSEVPRQNAVPPANLPSVGPTIQQRDRGPLPTAPSATPELAPPAAAAPATPPAVAAPGPAAPAPLTPTPGAGVVVQIMRKGVMKPYRFPDQKAANAALDYAKAHPNE